ncbi:unnamed protein product [Closterium sp. Naga37s-1]|nr:unnamed protein product [Closterium sp. Naga37s-1]
MKRRRRDSYEDGKAAAVSRATPRHCASRESPRTSRSAQQRPNQHGSVSEASPCEREAWRGQAAGNQAVRTSPCVLSPAHSPKARRAQQTQRQGGQRGRDDYGAAAAAARAAVITADGAEPIGSSGDCGCDSEAARQAEGQAPHPDAARRGACACRFCSWRFDSDDESDCERPCTARDSPRFRPQPVQGGWQGAAETGVRGAAPWGAELGAENGESGEGRAEVGGARGGGGEHEGVQIGGRGIYPAGRFVGSDGECLVLAGWDGCCVLLDSSTLQPPLHYSPCPSHSPPHATSPPPHTLLLPPVPPVIPPVIAAEQGSTGCAGAGKHAERGSTAEESSLAPHHSRASHHCCPPRPARMHNHLAPQQTTAAAAGSKVPLTPPASETPSLTPPTPQPASLPASSPHPSPLPSPPNSPAHPLPPAPPSWKHLSPPEWHAAPCGAALAMVQAGGSDVRIWDVRDGGVAVSMQTEGAVEHMACCAPMLWLDDERLVVVEEGGSVGLWHVAGGEAVLFHHVQLMDQWGEAERVCAIAVMPGRRCNKRLFPSLSVLLPALIALRGEGVTCAVACESAIYLADWSTPAVILHRIPSSHARPPDAMCFAGTSLFVALPSLPHEDGAAVQPSLRCPSPTPSHDLPTTFVVAHPLAPAHTPTRSSSLSAHRAAARGGTGSNCSTGQEGERYHLDSHVPRASRGPLLAVRVHAGRLFALHAGGVHVFRLNRAAQRGGGGVTGRSAGGDGGYEVRGRGYQRMRAVQGRRGGGRCGSGADSQVPVQRVVECGEAVGGRESGGAAQVAAAVLGSHAWRSGAVVEGSDAGSEGEQGSEGEYGREHGRELYEMEDVDGQEGEERQDSIPMALECSGGGGGGGVGSGRCEGETVEERRLVGVVGRRENGLLHPAIDVVGDRLLLVSANHPPCLYSCP